MTDYHKIAEDVVKKTTEIDAEAVFGETRQAGNTVIIPVAKMSYGWGGGGGQGKMPGKDQEGEGGGLGMAAKVKPVGFIEVTPEDVNYRPIIDFSNVATILSIITGFAALRLIRLLIKKTKR